MTTRMVEFPSELGKPTMKSKAKSSHTLFGISRGCKRSFGAAMEYLMVWHVIH